MIPQGQLQQQLNQAPSTPQRFPGSPMPRPAYQRPYSPQLIRSQINAPSSVTPNAQNYTRFAVNPANSPTPNYAASPSVGQTHSEKRRQLQSNDISRLQNKTIKKKGKIKDKILTQKILDLVPESQAYMELLAFERKLDATIMRKRLDIQEALKRPMKVKRKLRIFLTSQFHLPKTDPENEDDATTHWDLRIEGKLLDDGKSDNIKVKRKFSTFFKSLVIELDKDLYGPDNYLVEWHRTPQASETDGFQVKRPGDQNVKCTILMLLEYQPPQFKLDPRLSKFLGLTTATRPTIIHALWQYIKTHKLQNSQEKEFIDCDANLQEVFRCEMIRFSDIPTKLTSLCFPADPIVINHVINVEGGTEQRKTIYDVEVEVEDTLKDHMKNFIFSSNSLQEVATIDSKIHELIEQINQARINREFFLSFSEDPQDFIFKWIVSQSRDLKAMKDLNGNAEEERYASYYQDQWIDEAVSRYFYNKVQQRRAELEQVLGIRNN